ncbi:restriction endonuclease subunit S [Agromyces sp. ISL-38]|uniref:restriction endonuclease subunit S n=1 Tax=Agromyces sp. ISL-38 TaxID=2819107 RepID=UPI001BEAAA3D|nr:restriction endonuclease subunit S [Agromyces sp. ISL-38]MBT2500099.1 restriction endonuclease subunit S [Agromyces sp. ISL-38]
MSEWRSTTLGALVEDSGGSIQTGPFGSQLHASDYVTHGIPSVMPANIGDNVIVEDGIARINQADAERLSRHRLEPGDIVYSRRGDVERRALVRDENAGWLCGTGCLRVHFGVRPTVDPAFVSYCLGADWTREWIVQHAVGATMLNLNTGILSAVPLDVPNLAEQRAIAEVLGALDDKIAANTRLAETADGYVREARVATGGQDRIRVGTLVDSVRDAVDPGNLDPATPYIGLEHIPRRMSWLPDWGSAGDVTSGKNRFTAGDVLFGKLRPYFHKVVTAPASGVCSTDVVVLRAKSAELAGFAFAAISSDDVVQAVTASSEGTRMPRASWKDLAAVEVPWPGQVEAERFSSHFEQIRAAVFSALAENRTLAATRDTLLPQLMSGKLRVRDAEQITNEVVGP